MNTAPGDRTATRRPFVVPFLLGLCSLLLVRGGLEKFVPGVNEWVVFVAGLAVGWGVFTLAERVIVRRAAAKQEGLK
ncbi:MULTISPECIES: hypothetical protein [unclassified Phycicoccus]|uniref:hypothetical protein n=1 Tax=unclassified Phycicoccus TaxID=2637926 RepID=UPI0007032B6F|nr:MULTISPECIES: hypothetical protein [unclassified Phycicoccus]KQU67980.1 hypothetical protein ASC58_10260 [Phycicoccus sp. Root101]KQZ90084.1 hypothetical protein ASD62_13035 [Phycicoccus sp. Root563]